MFNLTVVSDVKNWWKWLSTWVTAMWATVYGYFIAYPEDLKTAWNWIPEDVRSGLPHALRWLLSTLIVIASVIAARIVSQKKPPI